MGYRIQGWPLHSHDQRSNCRRQCRHGDEDCDAGVTPGHGRSRTRAKVSATVSGKMRDWLRTRIHRNADARSAGAPRQIWQQCLPAGTELEERLWQSARLSEFTVDDLLQGRESDHNAPRRQRLVERTGSASHRSGLRFSSARPHGAALFAPSRDGRFASQHAGDDGAAVGLSAGPRVTPQRNVDERCLRTQPKHLPRDGTDHGAICERVFFGENAFALRISTARQTCRRTRQRFSHSRSSAGR